MRPFLSAIFTSLALGICIVRGVPSYEHSPKIKESVEYPVGWQKIGPAPSNHNINLRIGLPQPNFSTLERLLYEISDPDHQHYGQHLSKEEVEQLVTPHQESIDLVNEWLGMHGVKDSDCIRSPAKDWITITIPVSLAEKMLDTKYHIWEHTDSGDRLVRTTTFSLPNHLHPHIEVVQPTTMFARWKTMRSTLFWPDSKEEEKTFGKDFVTTGTIQTNGVDVDASCNTTITIKCLQQLYNLVGYKPVSTKKNAIGITGYLEQFANIQDLQSFYADQLPAAVGTSFKTVEVNGGSNSQNLSAAGIEANLDVQFAFGLSFPTPGTFWATGGRPPFKPDSTSTENTNEPYADWLQFVLNQKDIPHVISTSYGEAEQTVPESYARRACADFAQLGARGVTLTFSSGDGGVGDGNPDPATQQCQTNDGRNITRFRPLFPAGCPYVTAVGGTVNVPEIAVFFSGGGFSDYFPRPLYQAAAVEKYLGKLPKGTYAGLFNRNGRAIPDVAAEGRRFRVWVSGSPISVGGTSASSPTFAGVVALLNDARIAKHLPSLGFLNPLLYSRGTSAFNDITEGNNPGCGTPGFNATTGWDPITGLGTPNFQKLVKLVT